MNTPLVSIIIPVYNSAKFLADTLDSVIKQSYPHFEVLIINDGSTDNSEDVVKSYKDLRIRYFFQKNAGQAAASNFGIAQAKGELIKFLDSDDIINEQHLEVQICRLNGRTDAITSCAWGRFYDENPYTASIEAESVNQDLTPITWIKTALKQKADMMSAWRWLIPKKIIAKAGVWNEQLSLNNDFEFSIRLLIQAKEVLFTPLAVLYYRSGVPGSLSLTISEKAYHDAYLSTFLGCSYLLQAENSAEMKKLCANRYQLWIYRMYPQYTDLTKQFQRQVNNLGGSSVRLEGGSLLRITTSLFGWRTAKRIKLMKYKLFKISTDLNYKIT